MKNYKLTPEQEKAVEAQLAAGKEKYKLLEGIVWESQFDAGPFFEHEIEEKL